MGKGYRQGRLGEEIRRIISEMLLRDIKDPRLQDAMVSLSAVEVTSDGSYATCYVTILSVSGNEEEKKEKEVYKTKEKKETGIRTVKRTVIPENSEKWKPNALFFAGSGLCILITILYEILI